MVYKRKISLFLVIILLMSLFVMPSALAQPAENEQDQEASEVQEYIHSDENEIVELRTESSQTFQNPDGTLTAYLFSCPTFYRDADGGLTKIDNRVVAQRDGSYINAANERQASFSDMSKENKAVSLSYKDYSIAFSPQNAQPSAVAKYANQYAKSDLPEEISEGNSVLYQNVYDNIDMSYTVYSRGIKENIILKSFTGQNEFLFDTEVKNLTYKISENGEIIFINENGEEIFNIGGLYAIDADGNMTFDVQCVIEESGENNYILTLVVDEAFLANAAYPVIIDPTATIYGMDTLDTFVADGWPTRNFNNNNNGTSNMYYLRTGKDTDYGIRRSYVNFSNLSDIPSAATITSAKIRLQRDSSGGSINVRAHRVTSSWGSSTVTWNTAPGYSTSNISSYAVATGSNNQYTMDVTYWIQQFKAGTANYGFCIKDDVENNTNVWVTWRSSDYSLGTDGPVLIVDCTWGSNGTRPYQYVSSTSINCMGYALEYNQYITASNLGIPSDSVLVGKVTNEMLEFVNTKAQAWMNNNLPSGGYSSLSAYNSSLTYAIPGWFRVVLRVGFDDENYNGGFDVGEFWDFHWWYQTYENNGEWADKIGGSNSRRQTGSGGLNPCSSTWWGSVGYNSVGKYYQIKDSREW